MPPPITDANRYYAGRLLLKTNTLANWTSENPIIKLGEIVAEKNNTGPTKLKCGDGETDYVSLPYIFGGGTGGSGNLQQVLNTGNSATNAGSDNGQINLTDDGLSNFIVNGSGLQFADIANTIMCQLSNGHFLLIDLVSGANVSIDPTAPNCIIDDANGNITTLNSGNISIQSTSGGFTKTISNTGTAINLDVISVASPSTTHLNTTIDYAAFSGLITNLYKVPNKNSTDTFAMISDIASASTIVAAGAIGPHTDSSTTTTSVCSYVNTSGVDAAFVCYAWYDISNAGLSVTSNMAVAYGAPNGGGYTELFTNPNGTINPNYVHSFALQPITVFVKDGSGIVIYLNTIVTSGTITYSKAIARIVKL